MGTDLGTPSAFTLGMDAPNEIKRGHTLTSEYDGPVCIYCGDPTPVLDDYEPYCSALCACYASLDSMEDDI